MIDRKVALVTGGNKGIGREIARQLAGQGCVVWLGARDRERGEAAVAALEIDSVRFVALDVTDTQSIARAIERITRESGRLDILVNNAGVSFDKGASPSTLEVETLRRCYDINVFGPVQVTQACLPLLRRSPAGRIVMVSSGLGSLTLHTSEPDPFEGVNLLGYNSSKTALNAITVAFAKELAGTRIKVNAANPGYTATDMNDNQGTKTAAEGAAIEVKLAMLPEDGPTGGFFSDEGRIPW